MEPAVTLEAIGGLIDSKLSAARTETETMIREALTPVDRSLVDKVNGGGDPSKDKPSGIRMVDPRAHLYERMKRTDPEMANWRTSESDHWVAQYLRGLALPNDFPGARAQAEDELGKIYGRATVSEGTSNATSGLSGGTAGPLIPLPLASAIQLELNRTAKIRMLASVFQSSSKTLRIPTSGAATAAMAAEGAIAAQGEPTIGSKLLDKKKMQAQFAASKETLRDTAFDLVSFFAERAGSAFGQLEDVEICTGASTPTVTNAIITGVTDVAQGTPGTLIYKDVVDFWFTLPEQYQQNAVWLVASNVANFLSRLVITGGMGPVLVPKTGPFVTVGDMANVQGTIFGRPVIVVPLAAGSCVLGDVRKGYAILDEPGIEAEASAHAGWSTDSVFYKFTRRFDGNVLIADALRKFDAVTTIA